MDWEEKQLRLQKKARQDGIYRLWQDVFLSSQEDFREIADHQPDEVRKILWQYAESGRLMQQRLVNLACMYMDFSEEV